MRLYFAIFMCFCSVAIAQKDSVSFKLAAFGDLYLGGLFQESSISEKPSIFYNYTSYQKPDVNLAFVSFQLGNRKWQFQSDIMLGTYSNKNLYDEGSFGKRIYQLNLNYLASPKSQWLVGIFPSHLGFESAIGWDNPVVSRSYIAENSPYYESGVSWNYQVNENISTRLLLLTGWQNIKNVRPAFGTQLVYKNRKNWSITNGTFFGDEGTGSRLFLNNYVQIPLTKKWQTVLCFDWGMEAGKIWHGSSVIAWYKLSNVTRVGGRVEYYKDPLAVIIPYTFSDFAQSVNLDRYLGKKMMMRVEYKHSEKFGNEWLLNLNLKFSEIVSHSKINNK